MDMIKGLIGLFGGLVFLVCCLIFLVNMVMLIEAKVTKNETLHKRALRLLFINLIIGMVGFGTCSALFELKLG